MGWLSLFGDLRFMTGAMVALLGVIFIAYANRASWPYVRWLAGSAVLFGLAQLGFRVAQLHFGVRAEGIGGPAAAVVVFALTALLVGLHTYLTPGARHQGWRFAWLSALGLVWVVALVRALGDNPFRGPLASSGVLVAASLWLLWRWWHDRWSGQFALAAALLVQPLLLLLAIRVGLDVRTFREITPLPIVLVYFFVLTLILQRDARRLASELRRSEQAEAAMQRLADGLDRTVHERTAQLEAINQGLRAFSGMVSHDLRGPLRNIHGLSEMAREAIEEGQPAQALPLVRKLGHESLRASRMVSDLLDLARVEQQALQKAQVDFGELVRECVEQLAMEYPSARHAVRVGPLPVVVVDRGLMAHVVTNLVGNALKYGQGRPGLAVEVGAQREDQAWRFAVSDNGPGFDEARASELFKPFSRLAGEAVPGTGLGLTVVRRVVQQHGGEVGACGRVGEGARFWWTLPTA
ncbi:MAG: HAMP domain-containing histidine kinase [Comamonadaceae bacterium]|jgi:signal transduction histidine kinase|nr:HAMP domain-containing histidine kinase [Comamonadaceae bacterium]